MQNTILCLVSYIQKYIFEIQHYVYECNCRSLIFMLYIIYEKMFNLTQNRELQIKNALRYSFYLSDLQN